MKIEIQVERLYSYYYRSNSNQLKVIAAHREINFRFLVKIKII